MAVFDLLSVARTTRNLILALVVILTLLAGMGVSAPHRPAIILVPGAFHQPIVYGKVAELLHGSGYDHIHAVDLPSVGDVVGRDRDIAAVRNILLKELHEGRDVLLVGNSYGGTVIGEAVKGLKSDQAPLTGFDASSFSSRDNVRRGQILGLVFIAGYLPYINDVLHPETKPDIRTISPSFFRFTRDGKVFADGDPALPPEKTFYNGLPTKQAQYWSTKLQFSSFDALAANATYIPYTGDFKCHYVIGRRDVSVPPTFAETYIKQEGAKFEVVWLDADHIPMLSQPENVVYIIRKAARDKTLME